MSLGFNSNVDVGDAVYHVQTEARGLQHPFVDTLVLSGGRVLHRRSASYQDLLNGPAVDDSTLRTRIERQHQEVIDAIRAGSLMLEFHSEAIEVRLCNPTSWLVAGQASLEIEVLLRNERLPVAGAGIQVAIEGAEPDKASQFASQTGTDGRVRVSFHMPPLVDHQNPVLIIWARGAGTEDHLRYRLKRPRHNAPPAP